MGADTELSSVAFARNHCDAKMTWYSHSKILRSYTSRRDDERQQWWGPAEEGFTVETDRMAQEIEIEARHAAEDDAER